MRNTSVELVTWARIHGGTEIQHTVCLGGAVELTFGGPNGLTLESTECGLENLLTAVTRALHELRSRNCHRPDLQSGAEPVGDCGDAA